MAKRTVRGKKDHRRPVRQNRPDYRKKVIGREVFISHKRTGNKVKSSIWQKV